MSRRRLSLLFAIGRLRRWRGRRGLLRKHEAYPGRPSLWPVLRFEIGVCLEVEIGPHVADREKEADLRTKADRHPLEAAELGARTAVGCELLEIIAGNANKHVLADELRSRPIEMGVDAVLILQIGIGKAVGHPAHGG